MPRFSSPLSFLAAVSLCALALLMALALLPHDRYIRFQYMAAQNPHNMRAKWIYERVHFDPTPIDIAFIGTSHTQCAIDAQIVEDGLRRQGLPLHVVNFAVPRLGRDLHYLVTRELLENRRITTLVVELQEGESRAPHPAFNLLADTSDLFSGPLIINTGFFENIAMLPLRQTSLFLRTEFPQLFGLHRSFDLAAYEGLHWNDTYRLHGFTETRTGIFPPQHFAREVADMRHVFESKQALARHLNLPWSRYNILYRYNMIYLEKLLTLAQQKHVRIVFLYLPFFQGPPQPVDAGVMEHYGPILTPADILKDSGAWQNGEHVNVYGARRISDWISIKLSEILSPKPPALPPQK